MHVMGSVSPANERQGFSLQEAGVDVVVATPTSPPPPPSRLSGIEVSQTKSPPTAPAPPAPPPPPPPPPLLPLGPGLEDPTEGGPRMKKRVKSFFWKTIPEDQVKGRTNLWTQGQVQQQYQIDVRTIEELFGQDNCQSNSKATPTRGGRSRSSFRETKEEVSVLDSKRGMNIGIFLKQFKRSNQTIVDDIHHGNSEPYGAEPLRELLKLLPETEEVKKLRSYRGDVTKLSLADSFVYLLVQLPSYSVRIESMLLKEEFPAVCNAMKRDIRILRSATKELMCCEELHAVLHLVLQAGNILNAGGYAGNAVGFKLSSLLSLADTKANKPGMNLLHFVALEAQKKDERLLEFPLKLGHVQPAARVSLETLDAELHWLMTRTRSVEESVQRDTELRQQLDSFLQSASSSLCSLRGSRQQLRKEGSELIDFFCEDRDAFRLDDCFSIFNTFCSRFTDAVKENTEREVKEAARRRRLQELEEQKRHSWAGGEEVCGNFRLRCSSEADMSAAMSRQDDAGLLMELLTPKSQPRSPLNNSQNVLGRSGSLRRSRKSPSSSPSVAAERDLNMLLEMATPGHTPSQQRGGGEASTGSLSVSPKPGLGSPGPPPQTPPQSPRVTTGNLPQNQQPQRSEKAPNRPPSPRKTPRSPKKTNAQQTTTTYLSSHAPQTPEGGANPSKKVPGKPTSDSVQRSDHNNNNGSQTKLSDDQSQSASTGEATRINEGGQENGQITTGSMSVVLETCKLVPELKVFDKVTTESSRSEATGRQDDLVITDLEEEEVQEVQNKSQIRKTENSNVEKTNSSSSQRPEEERQEEQAIVWCVTGVCEAAGEFTQTDNTSAQTAQDQCGSTNQGGHQQVPSASANHTLLKPQPANEKPVPLPISSQPVPVSRCDDPSLQASSPRWRPAEPTSANEVPALTTKASEEGKEPANRGADAQGSSSDTRDVGTLSEQSGNEKRGNGAAPSHTANENTEAASISGKTEPRTSSKPSTKNASKSRLTATKLNTAPNTASIANKSRPVRTLSNSENQGMRRVVPISRTSRVTPSQSSRPEKPPGRSSGTAALTTLNVSKNTSLRRGERPSTAPSSRRSSIHKSQEPKDPKDQKSSGTQGSAREQSLDLQRKPSIRKPVAKPKPQQEEKMCRSTLRALSQAGEGGGSISAPATPSHKAPTPSSSPLPGFARSTASSSFRRTRTNLVPLPHSPHTGPDTSHKPPPKNTTSSGTSSPFTRTGSMRVTISSRSPDLLHPPSSSPLGRSQSIKAPPRSTPNDSLTTPKGHRRNDSGSFSEKSAHSRDSVKASRPSWR